jgi:hypothetical protein
MSIQFTQEEVEKAIADALKHGDRVDVARITGLSESYIKRQFNPDDHESVSCAFRVLQIACALDEIDGPRGEAFWRTLASFREMSKILRDKPVDLDVETGALGKEVAEFVHARISKKPIREQVRELLDVREQIEKIHNVLPFEKQISR